MTKFVRAAVLFVFAAGAQAETILIDFDEVTPESNNTGSLAVASKGFDFTANTTFAGSPPEVGVGPGGLYAISIRLT